MEKIKKMNSFAVLKTSIGICALLGLIVGLIRGLTSIPIQTTTSLNGDIIEKELLTNSLAFLFGVTFKTIFYFIGLALLIAIIIIAFNLYKKIKGERTVEIEKEKFDKY